ASDESEWKSPLSPITKTVMPLACLGALTPTIRSFGNTQPGAIAASASANARRRMGSLPLLLGVLLRLLRGLRGGLRVDLRLLRVDLGLLLVGLRLRLGENALLLGELLARLREELLAPLALLRLDGFLRLGGLARGLVRFALRARFGLLALLRGAELGARLPHLLAVLRAPLAVALSPLGEALAVHGGERGALRLVRVGVLALQFLEEDGLARR